MSIEAMKQALEALKWCHGGEPCGTSEAITAIKEALEQTQEPVMWSDYESNGIHHKPVAWMDADGNVSDNNDHKCFPIPLYTHPPQRTWVDVPDEEIKRLWIQYRAALPRYLCFAKDLLSIAKEKNT